jgi:hypothetical protein
MSYRKQHFMGQRQKQKQCCASEDEEGKALGLNTSDYQLFNGQTTLFLSHLVFIT